jgi:hypothetical protein
MCVTHGASAVQDCARCWVSRDVIARIWLTLYVGETCSLGNHSSPFVAHFSAHTISHTQRDFACMSISRNQLRNRPHKGVPGASKGSRVVPSRSLPTAAAAGPPVSSRTSLLATSSPSSPLEHTASAPRRTNGGDDMHVADHVDSQKRGDLGGCEGEGDVEAHLVVVAAEVETAQETVQVRAVVDCACGRCRCVDVCGCVSVCLCLCVSVCVWMCVEVCGCVDVCGCADVRVCEWLQRVV